MTSNLPQYRTLRAMESTRTDLGDAIDVVDSDSCGRTAELQLQMPLRLDDHEEEAPSAAAALFAGMFIGSGSTALIIWVASLVF